MSLIMKVLYLLIWFISFYFLFDSKAQAFLSPSSLSIITASFIPQLIAIFISIFLIIISFIKKYKKIFLLTFCIFAALVVLSTLSFLRIRKINQENRGLIWAEFKENYNKDKASDRWIKMIDSFSNMAEDQSISEELEDPGPDFSNYSYVIGATTLKRYSAGLGGYSGVIQETRGIDDDDFFMNVFTKAFDEKKLKEYLDSINLTKSEKVLIYCPAGKSSSTAAFILNYYGYNARFLALKNLDLKNSLLTATEINKKTPFFIILPIDKAQKNKEKIYFLLQINDLYDWDDVFCNNLKQDIILLKTNWLSIDMDLKCDEEDGSRSRTVFLEEMQADFFEDIRPELNLSQYQIVCRDNWHCLLTKHYLYLNDLSEEFNVLYCMDCDN